MLAWPEKVTIFIAVFIMAPLCLCLALLYSLPGQWNSYEVMLGWGILIVPVLHLWGAMRLIDWFMAGPARRAKDRILIFSP